MPGRYIVVDNGELVIERWVGEIHLGELLEHEQQQLNDTSIAKGAVVLTDARQAQCPELKLGSIRVLADLHTNLRNKTSVSKCALLVASDAWRQAKSIEREAEKRGVTVITFYSLDVACTWLGLDVNTVVNHIRGIVI